MLLTKGGFPEKAEQHSGCQQFISFYSPTFSYIIQILLCTNLYLKFGEYMWWIQTTMHVVVDSTPHAVAVSQGQTEPTTFSGLKPLPFLQ